MCRGCGKPGRKEYVRGAGMQRRYGGRQEFMALFLYYLAKD